MEGDGNSLYPIAVLIDELRNDDVQVRICLGVIRVRKETTENSTGAAGTEFVCYRVRSF